MCDRLNQCVWKFAECGEYELFVVMIFHGSNNVCYHCIYIYYSDKHDYDVWIPLRRVTHYCVVGYFKILKASYCM